MKYLSSFILLIVLSGCATFSKDENPTDLKKSPCACGEIYNSETDHVV